MLSKSRSGSYQTPDPYSRRTTCHNTLSFNETIQNKDKTIFSFTEVLDSWTENVNQHPSLDSLDTTRDKEVYFPYQKSVNSESKRVLQPTPPNVIKAKSEISAQEILDNTISTIHTLNEFKSTPTKLSYNGELEKQKEELAAITELKVKRPQRHRTLKAIKTNVDELLNKCNQITRGVEKINKKMLKTEAAYFKSLDELDEKLKDPPQNLVFWKNDKQLMKKRAQIQSEVDKFRLAYNESRKEQDKDSELDHYRQKVNWIDEDEEKHNFNPIQKILLKKPKPFIIKKTLSRKVQLDLRPKPFDINLPLITSPSSQEENSEIKAIIDNLNQIKPFIFGSTGSKNKKYGMDIENLSSSSSEETPSQQFCSKHVYYFPSLEHIRETQKTIKKFQPKRYCGPI